MTYEYCRKVERGSNAKLQDSKHEQDGFNTTRQTQKNTKQSVV
jgi:hypothetical protein